MKTFLIALGGIRVGAIRPLELATDGLLEVAVTPITPDLPGGFGYYAIPVMPRHKWIESKKKKTRDVSVTVQGCTIQTSAGEVEGGAVCRIEVQGCTITTSCAPPEIAFSCSFDVIGGEEENELETYLMAQAAFGMLYPDPPDPRDSRIRSLEKDVKALRDQLSREKRRK